MPRLFGEVTEPCENGVSQNAQRHRTHSADAVAEPAERQSAAGCAHEKKRGDAPHPESNELVAAARALHHVLQGRTRHQGEDSHLQTVEHPAEKGGYEHQPLAPGNAFWTSDRRIRCAGVFQEGPPWKK